MKAFFLLGGGGNPARESLTLHFPGMFFPPFPAGCFTEELDVAALVSPEAYLSDAIDGASTAYAELADQVATSQHQRAPQRSLRAFLGNPKKSQKIHKVGPYQL